MSKKDNKKGGSKVTKLPVPEKGEEQDGEPEGKDEGTFTRLKTIPIKKSFELEKLSNKLQGTYQAINSQKMKLIEKYGMRDEKANQEFSWIIMVIRGDPKGIESMKKYPIIEKVRK